ncbi:MAG: inositol monophosphatase [Candidatus Atribacteria bacterium]|nr:inositol monophosphatase [Candidatus Atribacteria bacterium]
MTSRLSVALEVAQKVGKFVMAHQNSIREITEKSSPIDVVTEVDKEAQKMIIKELSSRFTQDLFWGEESGYPLEDFSSTWVIDPIDGTSNYIHNLPLYGISIAYLKEGKPIIGVLEFPRLRETFWAEKGEGAFLNGERIQVSEIKEMYRAIVGTGFPHRGAKWQIMEPIYAQILSECQALRSLGSAALGVAYVACGRLEGYLQLGLSFYDIAAAICLVEEAGGKIRDLKNKEWSVESRSILATNSKIGMEKFLKDFSLS